MAENRNVRGVNDWYRLMPKKDNFGKIGHENFRWSEIWCSNFYGTPYVYSSTMTGAETFTDPKTLMSLYFLDPSGGDRNFNPSGTFRTGCVVHVKNTDRAGNYIIFDSTSTAQVIAPGELGIFLYNGTSWL